MSIAHRTFRLPLPRGADPSRLLQSFAGPTAAEVLRHDWAPHGATVVQVQGSATFILHTWPERELFTLDIIYLKNEQTLVEVCTADLDEG